MLKPVTISSTTSSFPDYLDFKKLREAGIEHIVDLGSDLWTDYNLHDPGITILEVLCYALTDLGFRTNFDIKDLLTRSAKQKADDQAIVTPDGKLYNDNFYTPEQILTCNPVTLLDIRKLLIDIPGVKNAWIELAKESEPPLYVDYVDNELQYTVPEHVDADDEDKVAEVTLSLRGLYNICLEIEIEEQDACSAPAAQQACPPPSTSIGDVLVKVYAVLHEHRNLCEDFLDVIVLRDEEIALCADIELAPEADPEDVLLEIYKKVQEFLSPTLRFYTLQEMLEKGTSIEKIFEGRPLTPLRVILEEIDECENVCLPAYSHGFIDTDELKATEPRSALFASDIIREVMAVEGVLAVRKLILINFVNDLPQTLGEKWCLDLTPKHRLLMDLEKSKITFYKGLLPFYADKDKVQQRYAEEKAASTKALLEADQLDVAVPEGTHRPLDDYTSIQHEFPLVYGIGDEGLGLSETQERKAQARQLKGYLLFFDQILANYLAQLANLRELFSMRPDAQAMRPDAQATEAPRCVSTLTLPRQPENNRTYFTQLLEGVPRVEELIRNFNDCQGGDGYLDVPEDYPDYLNFIAESVETYDDRRNRFLDHLLARFAESFTDYVLLMFTINGERQDNSHIIQDKTDFLSTYPETSRDRGKGFNHTDPRVWDTDNVSGLQKRVSKLMGIDYVCRRYLHHIEVVEIEDRWHFQLRIDADYGEGEAHEAENESTVLESKRGYSTQEEAGQAFEAFLELARDEANYRRLSYEGYTHYGFGVLAPAQEGDEDRALLATFPQLFPRKDERSKATDTSRCEDERSQAIDTLRSFFGGEDPSFSLQTVEENGFFFFKLEIPELGDLGKVTITGSRRFVLPDQAEAEGRLFIEQAQDTGYLDDRSQPCNYRAFSEDGFTHFGYIIVDDQGACVVESSERFTTSEDRYVDLFNLITYVNGGGKTCEVFQKEDCFFYHLYDASGETLLFVGEQGYKTEAQARAAYEAEFLPRAQKAENYYDLDDGDGYGFELIDLDAPEEGRLLARHPHFYDTEQERDDRKQAILYYLTDDPVRFSIGGTPGSYRFEMRDSEGVVLFVSQDTYATEAAALEAYRKVLRLARFRVYYQERDDLEGEAPYGFELLDRRDRVIAFHPTAYETDCARDLAMDAILNLLCKEEDVDLVIIEQEGAYQFVLQDDEGKQLLLSAETFASEEEAREAFKAFRRLAIKKDQYKLLDEVTEDKPYGFEVVDDEGVTVATHPRSYAFEKERDLAIRCIINYICPAELGPPEVTGKQGAYHFFLLGEAEDVHYEITKTEGVYGFELHDDEGNPLFVSAEAFASEEQAQEAFEAFRALAANADYYKRLDEVTEATPYGFELVDEQDATVATHPASYESEIERDLVIQSLVNIPYRVLFQSTEAYPDQVAARKAFDAFILLGRDKNNYFRHDDEGLYGFDLRQDDEAAEVDEDDEVVAEHRQTYAYVAEREAAIALILAYLRHDDVVSKVVNTEGSYYFVVEDEYGRVLLVATGVYLGKAEAEAACRAAIERAADTGSRHRFEDGSGHCRFGFEILDEAGEALARHPQGYTTAAARDEAIEHLLYAVRDGSTIPDAIRPNLSYCFELHDAEGAVLLRSTGAYDAEAEATEAYDACLVLAADPATYHAKEEGGVYEFEIHDEEGATVATHEGTYAGEEQRDAAIDALVFYVRSRGVPHAITETDGLYYFQLKMKNDTEAVVLEGTEGAEDEAASREALLAAFERAAAKAHYDLLQLYDDEACTYSYSFRLLDEDAGEIATHPASYETAEERDAYLAAWIAYLAGLVLPHEICETVVSYYYEVVSYYYEEDDLKEKTLLKSVETWTEHDDAKDAFLNTFVRLAQERDHYVVDYDNELENCHYTFKLVDGTTTIASQPDLYTYKTRREVEEQIQDIIDYIGKQELTCKTPGTACGYYFRVSGVDYRFVSTARYPEASRAWSACNRLLMLLSDDEDYYEVVGPEGGPYRLIVRDPEDGVELAYYEGPEEGQEELEALIADIQAHVSEGLEPEYDEQLPFEYQLLSREGEVLFESRDAYDALKEGDDLCEARAWKASNRFVERVQKIASFRLIMDPNTCLYGFELMDETGGTMAVHSHFYSSPGDRDNKIQAIINLVNDEGFHLVEHLLLRPKNKGVASAYFFELTHHETQASLFRSVTFYDESEEAVADLRRLLIRILIEGTEAFEPYTITTDGSTCYGFRLTALDDQGQEEVLAEHLNFYGSEAARHAAMTALVAYVRAFFKKVLDEDENTFGLADDLSTVVDTLLQAALDDDVLEPYIGDYSSAKDREKDGFLPLDECCFNDDGTVCSISSDPYSFRGTVVLPYWPERFRNVVFRNFFERTLRAETPAHIFLRICWVDVCQMHEFEHAYRRWLKTLATPGGDCDATAALNRLLKRLVRLRNVYPEATLGDCQDGGDGSTIILNQTLLGDASFLSDDNG